MTQMEPISARFAFPGFDEPDFKTPFDHQPDRAQGRKRAWPTPRQVKEVAAGKGWKTLTFATTLPLPTYLVAFGVGPWDIVKGRTSRPTPTVPSRCRCAASPPRAKVTA